MMIMTIGNKDYQPTQEELHIFQDMLLKIEKDTKAVVLPSWVTLQRVEFDGSEKKVISCGNCGGLVSPGHEKCPYCGGCFA